MSRNPHATALRHFKQQRIPDKREALREREDWGWLYRHCAPVWEDDDDAAIHDTRPPHESGLGR